MKVATAEYEAVCEILDLLKDAKEEVKKLVGKDRRTLTETEARRLLSFGRAEEARMLVPWRDPRVWKALKLAEPDKDCRWGHATWSPKKSWPKLA